MWVRRREGGKLPIRRTFPRPCSSLSSLSSLSPQVPIPVPPARGMGLPAPWQPLGIWPHRGITRGSCFKYCATWMRTRPDLPSMGHRRSIAVCWPSTPPLFVPALGLCQRSSEAECGSEALEAKTTTRVTMASPRRQSTASRPR